MKFELNLHLFFSPVYSGEPNKSIRFDIFCMLTIRYVRQVVKMISEFSQRGAEEKFVK